MDIKEELKNGSAFAAILSASLGCFVIGLSTVLSSVSVQVNDFLIWWTPAGPLTGKTAVGVIVWIVSWFVFSLLWSKKDVNLKVGLIISYILLFLGFLGTFPPFYEALHPK